MLEFEYDGRSHRGRPSSSLTEARIRDALHHLDDPVWLETSALASLPAARLLADTEFKGRAAAKGRALQKVLRLSLMDLVDISGVLGALAVGYLKMKPQSHVALEAGKSPSWVCRKFKPQLLGLVRQRLEFLDDQAKGASR